MAGAQGSAMAAAVSRAGGLGSLPCAMLTPEGMRAELEALRRHIAGPWNVNFFCHEMPVPDASREAGWRAALRPYHDEWGIDQANIDPGSGRLPFGPEAANLLAEYRPAVVSFHFGLPAPDLLERVKSCGAQILSTATTVEEARWLEAHGADAVIAQGYEAGGHRGMFLSRDLTTQIGTLALVRQIVRAVRLPVIAAGGISDAEGVRSALALGAAGVQAGTAFLFCPEATISAVHRAALRSETAGHTVLTNVFTGRPARGIANRLIREIGPISPLAPDFPLATGAVAPLRARAEAVGSGDFSPLWSGQNARGCAEMPAADLTRRLAGY
jgi:nitronate monooxygenase